ncbi:MAG: hypothetical protein ACREDR_30805, partial [Blastocatellia bacterium]
MTVSLIGLLSIVLPLCAAPGNPRGGQAQKAAAELPRSDQILSKYVAAVGGKDAIEKIKTLVARGSITLPAIQREGDVEIYRVAPNKYLFSANITGFGVAEQCYDGKSGWSRSPRTGLRNLAGLELGQTKREADLFAPLHLKDMYISMIVKGVEKVEDHDTYAIVGVTPEGNREKLYFDEATGLLVKIDQFVVSPLGTEPMQVYYEDYRD